MGDTIVRERFYVRYAVISDTSGGYSWKDVWRAAPDHHGILPGSKWCCLLLRIVLQDAMSEVTKVYPPPQLRVSVDDLTAFVNGRNKELMEMAKKGFEDAEEREREERLQLSITGFRECSKKERVVLATSVETLSGLENENQAVGERSRRRRRRKCDVRFCFRNNRVFRNSDMRTGGRKLLRTHGEDKPLASRQQKG